MSMSRSILKTRIKKINLKSNLQILREDQVDALADFESNREVDLGVEKGEVEEYHLQQAIKASQALKEDAKLPDAYIPTPPTIASEVQYDVLYAKAFQQPATYIRSSATVEDGSGVPYCMDEEDELALKLINKSLPDGQPPVTDAQFEQVMNFFEEASTARQPFALVDSSPVLPLEELQEQFDDTHSEGLRTLSPSVYEHWSARRNLSGNRPLGPSLRFETHQESDDSDPYVCFRRRELRQTRKTRHRDAQVAEKLRKLRLELETARNVLLMVRKREQVRLEVLNMDRQVFEQRLAFRETKRKLGIKGDEELLVNVKKQKLPQGISPNQAALAHQLRLPLAAGPGTDLRLLDDVQNERSRTINSEIQINIDKHIRWNEGYVDKTKAPLTPDTEKDFDPQPGQFREAMPATYLPTPPASHSDEEGIEPPTGDVEMKDASRASTPFRYASPVEDEDTPMPAFRRRYGRGGRILFDRRFPFRQKRNPDDDRWKFDSDNEDEIEELRDTGSFDDRSAARMMSRAYLFGNSRQPDNAALQVAQRKAQLEASQASGSHPTITVSTSQQISPA